MPSKHLLQILCLLVSAAVGCQESHDTPTQPVRLDSVLCLTPAMDPITNRHVMNVLRRNSIPYDVETSVWATIYVSSEDVSRAEKLLRESTENTDILLEFYDDEEGKRPKVEIYGRATEHVETALPLPISKTSDSDGFDLPRILDTIRNLEPDSIINLHSDYDKGALRASRRLYLGANGEVLTGLDVHIRLSSLAKGMQHTWEQSYSIWSDWQSIVASPVSTRAAQTNAPENAVSDRVFPT